jgi:regulatory protein
MKIVSAKKQNNKIYVVFDDGNIVPLFADIFVEYKLSVNSEISKDLYLKICEQNDERILINYAKRLLGNKLYSVKSLKTKLVKKTDNIKIVDKVIALLCEYGYLNDVEFAELYIKNSLLNKKKGRIKIRYNLKKEGIASETIDELLNNIEEDAEFETALKLAKSKIRLIKVKDEIKVKGKLFRYLQSRGFGRSICIKILNNMFKNNEEMIYE